MALKILLADDSMTAQNMGKKILTDAGYEVVAVSNGAAAVKKIAEHKPDLAVLDVYMPGYTGLEVCERLKGALDTTHMPVLLTVGRMEPFKPEEGSRVKADGIIIKPFEASDLLAAIQKLEQRLSRAVVAAVPADDGVSVHEKTQKIRIPYLDEFKDASYEEWKVAAGDQSGDGERDKSQSGSGFSVPEAMQASPAMAMDELEIVPPAANSTQRVTQPVEPPPAPMRTGTTQLDPSAELAAAAGAPAAAKSTSGVWKALDKARDWFGGPTSGEPGAKSESTLPAPPQQSTDHIPGLPVGPAIDSSAVQGQARTIQEITYEKTRAYSDLTSQAARHAMPAMAAEELQYTAAAPAPVNARATKDPHLETMPSLELDGLEIAPEPGLEPTISPKNEMHSELTIDPALVTDSAALAGEFPTRFGVTNADVVPVGIASDFPQMYSDAISAAEPEAEIDEPLETVAPVKDPGHSVASAPMQSGWMAEEAPVQEHEHSLKLHDEMRQVYSPSASPVEDDVTEVELVEPDSEAAAQAARDLGSAPDPQLAAAMAAAVGAEVVPVVTHSIAQTTAAGRAADDDENSSGHTALIADIVHRVTEMMKPELIRRITDELAKKKR